MKELLDKTFEAFSDHFQPVGEEEIQKSISDLNEQDIDPFVDTLLSRLRNLEGIKFYYTGSQISDEGYKMRCAAEDVGFHPVTPISVMRVRLGISDSSKEDRYVNYGELKSITDAAIQEVIKGLPIIVSNSYTYRMPKKYQLAAHAWQMYHLKALKE